jgi:hypothetical protein
MPWKIVAGDKGCHADAPKANGGTAVRCEDGLWTEQAIAGIPGAAHVSALIQEAVDVSEIRRHRKGLLLRAPQAPSVHPRLVNEAVAETAIYVHYALCPLQDGLHISPAASRWLCADSTNRYRMPTSSAFGVVTWRLVGGTPSEPGN